ncbi:MAG: hypothetical protein ABI212_03680 [Burkholderiaceae bacterium]
MLHEALAGEFFAETLPDSPQYHYDAVAAEPSDVLHCPADAMKLMLQIDSAFARQWASLLAPQLRQARTRIERISPEALLTVCVTLWCLKDTDRSTSSVSMAR